MPTRISLFNNSGEKLAEIDANVSRSWKLNEDGAGTFTMSTQDTKAIIDYLEFGNFVYMEHDKLPIWGGMIDTPRTWGVGTITSSIYSAEYVLKSHVTPNREDKFTGVPGSIFNKLTSQSFGTGSIPVIPGDIYGGGISQSITYNYAIIYDAVIDLAKKSGADWDLTPAIDPNGKLYFISNWYERKGVDRVFRLYEDLNIKLSTKPMVEQGEIANVVIGFGNGSSWTSKYVDGRLDAESVGRYGWRTKAVSIPTDSYSDLITAIDEQLLVLKNPRRTFDITALDVGDTFYNCRIGDVLPVDFYTIGFTGDSLGLSTNIKILQMAYNDIDNQLKIVCDEVV